MSDTEKGKSIKQEGKRGWYVIHTYAGYEDQVAESLQQRVESTGMHDFIFNVIVPTEKQIEIKNGKRQVVEKKIFPGYVLVEMVVRGIYYFVVNLAKVDFAKVQVICLYYRRAHEVKS